MDPRTRDCMMSHQMVEVFIVSRWLAGATCVQDHSKSAQFFDAESTTVEIVEVPENF